MGLGPPPPSAPSPFGSASWIYSMNDGHCHSLGGSDTVDRCRSRSAPPVPPVGRGWVSHGRHGPPQPNPNMIPVQYTNNPNHLRQDPPVDTRPIQTCPAGRGMGATQPAWKTTGTVTGGERRHRSRSGSSRLRLLSESCSGGSRPNAGTKQGRRGAPSSERGPTSASRSRMGHSCRTATREPPVTVHLA